MKIIGDGGHAAVVRELLIDWPYAQGTVIAVGDNAARQREAKVHAQDTCLPLIHRHAIVSRSATIGRGTVIMAGAIVQAHARIGEHCIVNTGATVDHHCTLEDFVHIAPGAHLCGNVTVGEGTLVGVGVGIAPNTTIPPWSIVKAARLDVCPMQ